MISLYLLIFGCYILFTRVPDYFDGEKYPGTICVYTDSGTTIAYPHAVYFVDGKKYAIDARYFPYNYIQGEKLMVIMEKEHPAKAAVYRFWGYWIIWGELVGSTIAAILLFQVAVSITKNPTPEALMEQLSYREEKKTKYE
ncbi:MAG: hypothetical protein K2X37_03930 [Chitinophagaceae bacterium]|nr:hypothetical protein [Chitinophagaceae bacterium]